MTAQTILPANSATAATGYNVANSLRFNESDDCLIKTFGSAGNTKLWTYSVWFKRGKLGGSYALFVAGASGGNDESTIRIEADKIDWQNYDVGTSAQDGQLLTNQLIRDPSAWYHLVCAYDSANSTAGNRMRMYLNGSEVTSFATDNNSSVNYDSATNSAVLHNIGRQSWNSSADFAGYMAEICFIDGAALTPTSFGEFDGDSPTIWKPLESVEDLTFGDNGFYLEFKESGTGTDANGMGADTSGEDNHFAVNNLTAVDQSTDTCTNNFATFNPLTTSRQSGGVVAYSEGNTKIVTAHSNANYLRYPQAYTTLGVTSGKWYAEFKIGAIGSAAVGIANTGEFGSDGTTNPYAGAANSGAVYTNGGEYRAGAFSDAGSQGTYTEDDIIGCALDLDNLAIYWHKNGTYINSGDPTSGSSKTGARAVQDPTTPGGFYVFTAGADNSGNATIEANFGSPSYANSSSATDGRVHGDFEYAPPSGFFALCSKNLGEFG